MSDMEKVKVSDQEPNDALEESVDAAVEGEGSERKGLKLSKTSDAPQAEAAPEEAPSPKVSLGKGAAIIPDDDDSADDSVDDSVDEGVDEGDSAPRFEKKAFVPWPVEPDHSSAQEMLMTGEDVDLKEVLEDQKLEAGGAGMNFFLLILVLAASAGGIQQLRIVSDPAILEAKRAAAAEEEQAHLEEQLKLKKTYGVLNIDSLPQQATIYKRLISTEDAAAIAPDFKPIESKNKMGETVRAMTPLIMKDMDIKQVYEFRLEMDGYLPYSFNVAQHIWTKEGTDFKFVKKVDMTAMACEHWFLYDSDKKEEQQFENKQKCNAYTKEAKGKNVSVTPCTCKALPEGVEPGDKKEEKKK